jgi:recombination protein RecA
MSDTEEALQETLDAVEREFGEESLMRLDNEGDDPDTISTGSLKLDKALGVGGLPRGRITEIFGPESSGKTTLATHVIAEAQKEGGTCAFIDAEHAFDTEYAKSIGVDVENCYISQPENGERALGIADALVRGGAFDVIVVDSVSSLVPQAELEGDMGDSHIGLQARLMSQALRKLTGTMNRTKTAFIFINQIRMKVGQMFGNPETTSGGKALRFYASVRLDIRRIGAVKDSDGDIIGNETRVRVKKNKVAAPFKKAEFELIYGEGISRLSEIVDLATEHGIIDKAGSWYKRDGDTIAQGAGNTKEWLRENPEERKEIVSLIEERA